MFDNRKLECRAKFHVTLDELAEMLHLPPCTEVLAIEADFDDIVLQRRFYVYVTHHHLPIVPDGGRTPTILSPVGKREFEKIISK